MDITGLKSVFINDKKVLVYFQKISLQTDQLLMINEFAMYAENLIAKS